MKIDRILFLLFVLLFSSLNANEPLIQKKKVSNEVALPLLQSIDEHALKVGSGPTQLYAFIDPLCPRSRDFVEMVFDNAKMQKLYTYHFFLYELKRFHTKEMISAIYSADEPLSVLEACMLKKKKLVALSPSEEKIEKKIASIAKVAEQLGINKRPYLFVFKPKKGGK